MGGRAAPMRGALGDAAARRRGGSERRLPCGPGAPPGGALTWGAARLCSGHRGDQVAGPGPVERHVLPHRRRCRQRAQAVVRAVCRESGAAPHAALCPPCSAPLLAIWTAAAAAPLSLLPPPHAAAALQLNRRRHGHARPSHARLRNASPEPSPRAARRYVIDAEGQTLGRVASLAAYYIRGKHLPTYTPSMDMGGYGEPGAGAGAGAGREGMQGAPGGGARRVQLPAGWEATSGT